MRYFLQTLFRAMVTGILVITFIFVILRVASDPVLNFLGEDPDPLDVEYYTSKWGLDRPLLQQYFLYFGSILQGDLGESFVTGRSATADVLSRLPNTIILGATSLLLSLAFGIPLGVYSALRRGTFIDNFVMGFAVFGFAIPNHFLGILLILMFSLWWPVLPSFGGGSISHLIMPAFTLGVSGAGGLARYARSSMLEVLEAPYMRTAKAFGNSRRRRVWVHAMPNVLVPIFTILGVRVGGIIGGSVVVETVFAWPGVGRLLVDSVNGGNLPVVQVAILAIAITTVGANLLVDYSYGLIDPRIRRR